MYRGIDVDRFSGSSFMICSQTEMEFPRTIYEAIGPR